MAWFTSKGKAQGVEEPDWEEEASSSKKKKKKGKKGEFSRWYEKYMAEDPTDKDKFPHFQVWTNCEWSDYRETTNDELRNKFWGTHKMEIETEGTVFVDMGEDYQYDVIVTPQGKKHPKVQEAINAVNRMRLWEESFEDDCVGWQAKRSDEEMSSDDNAEKIRPVRILRQKASFQNGHFQ